MISSVNSHSHREMQIEGRGGRTSEEVDRGRGVRVQRNIRKKEGSIDLDQDQRIEDKDMTNLTNMTKNKRKRGKNPIRNRKKRLSRRRRRRRSDIRRILQVRKMIVIIHQPLQHLHIPTDLAFATYLTLFKFEF